MSFFSIEWILCNQTFIVCDVCTEFLFKWNHVVFMGVLGHCLNLLKNEREFILEYCRIGIFKKIVMWFTRLRIDIVLNLGNS